MDGEIISLSFPAKITSVTAKKSLSGLERNEKCNDCS